LSEVDAGVAVAEQGVVLDGVVSCSVKPNAARVGFHNVALNYVASRALDFKADTIFSCEIVCFYVVVV